MDLARHTRYRIGGSAPRFGRPESRPALAAALQDVSPHEVRVLGWGANVLVSDAGVDEPVIVLGGDFSYVNLGDCWIEAGAAAGLPTLVGEVRRAARADWSFLEAVPGSIGGGLRMNAGSTDTGIWDRVVWAEAMTPAGETVRLTPEEAGPEYRSVAVSDAWVF
ncbi:MAG: FAD-binding protein, partial [Gemmatimonadota bacterium]